MEKNEKLREEIDSENIIVEGKHRWLDAKEKGLKKIWAWVGDKALTEDGDLLE